MAWGATSAKITEKWYLAYLDSNSWVRMDPIRFHLRCRWVLSWELGICIKLRRRLKEKRSLKKAATLNSSSTSKGISSSGSSKRGSVMCAWEWQLVACLTHSLLRIILPLLIKFLQMTWISKEHRRNKANRMMKAHKISIEETLLRTSGSSRGPPRKLWTPP